MIAAVLQAALQGANFTKIMFTAYMSYQQCNEYMDLVIKRGLLKHDREERLYTTTEKGKEFLGIYEKIKL
ncbi:MAG: winged helix-turn-helix domain-containing protein [Nitrososphaera sp.]|nr:winged helix-turn-helix domain-containing protein [Nitrososphaera sp.]